jgi:hypothetical protein
MVGFCRGDIDGEGMCVSICDKRDEWRDIDGVGRELEGSICGDGPPEGWNEASSENYSVGKSSPSDLSVD